MSGKLWLNIACGLSKATAFTGCVCARVHTKARDDILFEFDSSWSFSICTPLQFFMSSACRKPTKHKKFGLVRAAFFKERNMTLSSTSVLKSQFVFLPLICTEYTVLHMVYTPAIVVVIPTQCNYNEGVTTTGLELWAYETVHRIIPR